MAGASLLTGNFQPSPPKGAALTSLQPRPFIPWVTQPWGLFRLFPPSSCPGGWRPSPGASGQAQPHFRLPFWPLLECPAFPLCIFSLGGGLGAGNPAHILSPPSLWRTKLTRAEAREGVVVWRRLPAHCPEVLQGRKSELRAGALGASSEPIIIAPSIPFH